MLDRPDVTTQPVIVEPAAVPAETRSGGQMESPMKGLLAGKTAIVTGGGSGIGRAVAIGFAASGAQVAICGRRQAELDETAVLIEQAGGAALALAVDISKAAEVEDFVGRTVGHFGRLDIAFNNAGIGSATPVFAELDEAGYDAHFDINVRGTFLCMKYEIMQMLAQGGGGTVINNASVQSHIALGHSAHYTASKHAVLGYTKAAAVDHARDGIRVNAIAPGIVMTPMMAGFDPNATAVASIMSRIPAGTVIEPEDLVGLVVFMASDLAHYMNGTSVAFDGGWLAH